MIKKTLLALFLVTLSFSAEGKNPTTITVAFNNSENFPYCLGNGKEFLEENPGVAIEAMETLEKKLNIKFNFVRETWPRQQKKIQYNQIDMLFTASYKKEREKLGVYPKKDDGTVDDSKRVISSSYMLYKLKDSPLDWDGENFKNLEGAIITQKGYSIVSLLKDKGVEYIENRSNTDLNKVLAKRAAGAARHEYEFDKYFKANPDIAKKIVKHPIPLTTKPYYLLVSHQFYKENPTLTEKIWEELKNMDRVEKFQSIRSKY